MLSMTHIAIWESEGEADTEKRPAVYDPRLATSTVCLASIQLSRQNGPATMCDTMYLQTT